MITGEARSDASTDVAVGPLALAGFLAVPRGATALVVFAHGSGSSRFSERNRMVARALNDRGIGTLLFDLLTEQEEHDRQNVFDIGLLGYRLIDVVRWVDEQQALARLCTGLFGASTGAAAALVAAAELGPRIGAVVSRGGRPDLAGASLARVHAPTLLLVGGRDVGVIELNEAAFGQLRCVKSLQIIAGATHLFPERGAMEAVVQSAMSWFKRYLIAGGRDDHVVSEPR